MLHCFSQAAISAERDANFREPTRQQPDSEKTTSRTAAVTGNNYATLAFPPLPNAPLSTGTAATIPASRPYEAFFVELAFHGAEHLHELSESTE